MEDGPHTTHPPNGEGKIGRTLERARKDRGLSLDEAERATKIRKRYLAGLEADDYTVLPDAVYAQAFLKTYANFLGLDGDELSRGLGTRRKPRPRSQPQPPGKSGFGRPIVNRGVSGASTPRVSRSAAVTLGVGALVIAALVGTLYYVGLNVRASAGDETPERATGQAPAEAQAEAQAEAPANAPADRQVSNEASLETLRVGVRVEGSPAWLRITSDSETVFEEVAQPGYARTFEARRAVNIEAGNAGAVSVEVNGQDVGALGKPGQVLDRSFTLKSEG